jgi:hypothetical protein
MEFFVVTIIDIHQLNLRPFGNLNFLVENSLKIFFFHFIFFKVKYFIYLKKKPIPNERERDFIVGHCIIFSDFFCLLMSYEPQT